MKKRKVLIILSIFILSIIAVSMLFIISVVIYYNRNINTDYDDKLFNDSIGYSSTIFYANSNVESDEYIPTKIDVSSSNKQLYYEIEEISNYLIDGFIAVEDRSFYTHSGVNVRRTLLATLNYLFGKTKTFGASTITQQVVKNISGDNEATIKRKVTEMLRAYNIEKKHTKTKIMEVYLNVIPMGNGLYGVGAASQYYFDKLPSELTISEAATLIGITNAPSLYNPYSNYDKCLTKRNIVLQTMLNQGVILSDEYSSVISEPIKLSEHNSQSVDSWFTETVISDVCNDYAKQMKISPALSRLIIMSGGHSIYTTMNVDIQNILEEYFTNEKNFSKEISNGLNYSMIIINPKNGDVLGVVGGAGKKRGNRILNQVNVPHIPASTLKPIALYAPLIDQRKISWSTVFDDIPVNFSKVADEYKEYPKNSPPIYDGLVTIKDAIKKSKNTIAIKLCQIIGEKNIFNNLVSNYKFDTLVDKDKNSEGETITDIAIAPMALGQLSNGVSLRKMTEAYTAFSNKGVRSDSRTYIKVCDKNGEVILEKQIRGNRVFSEDCAKIMNQLLSEVVKSGTAKSITLKNKTAVAGKTGTSSNNRDKMFIGYTPKLTAGIWCGYNTPTEILGITPTHLNVWDSVMKEIYIKCYYEYANEKFDISGLDYEPYCVDSGKQYTKNCLYDPRGSRIEYGYFMPDDKSYTESCDRHVVVDYNTIKKGVVVKHDENSEDITKISLIKNEDRSFPKEVYITDAEYVYRDIKRNNKLVYDPNKPYFYSELENGEYVGISNKKKQFNSLPIESDDIE